MSDKALSTYPGGRGKKSTFTGIEVDSLVACRETFGRITKAYAAGEVSESQSRTIAYLLTGMLSYWRLEADLSIQEDIEQIKAQLAELRQ